MGLIADIIVEIINIYIWIIIIYIFMSWFPGARNSAVGQFMGAIVEPYLDPFRRIIPSLGMIDISPIIAILVLRLAQTGAGYLVNLF